LVQNQIDEANIRMEHNKILFHNKLYMTNILNEKNLQTSVDYVYISDMLQKINYKKTIEQKVNIQKMITEDKLNIYKNAKLPNKQLYADVL